MRRLALAVCITVGAALLGACATVTDSKDRLSVAMEVMTAYAKRVAAQTDAGVLPVAEARKRLELGQEASTALSSALKAFEQCEGAQGKCDMQTVVGGIGNAALDRLESHFLKTGQFSEADAIAAARIIYGLMRGSAEPEQVGGGGAYSAFFRPLVERFNAAVSDLAAAVARKS